MRRCLESRAHKLAASALRTSHSIDVADIRRIIEMDEDRQLRIAKRSIRRRNTGDTADPGDGFTKKEHRSRVMDARARGLDREIMLPSWARNKATVYECLGLHGFCSTATKPFHGLFRQHWSDFCVTEMATWGSPLSREIDASVPSLPEGFCDVSSDNAGSLSRAQEKIPVMSDDVAPAPDSSATRELYAAALLNSEKPYHLQMYLQKQHVAHAVAIDLLARLFRVHRDAISVAGVKDFIGDTVQRIRIRGTSAGAALQVNEMIRTIIARKATETEANVGTVQQREPHEVRADELLSDASIQLHHFSYERGPLRPGHLAGNHFRIVLRDVDVSSEDEYRHAVKELEEKGCTNYYGSQRFSWFAGADDPGFAIVQCDFARFLFLFLDFTRGDRTLRELLQRRRVYPIPMQNVLRHIVVRKLKAHEIHPAALDALPVLRTCPKPGEVLERSEELSEFEHIILQCIREAVDEISHETSFHLQLSRVPSLLWNLAVSIRRELFGDRVLVGDLVFKPGHRDAILDGPPTVSYMVHDTVTEQNKHQFSIFDVLHPHFSFHGHPLPHNAVRDIYLSLCDEFGLDWSTNYTKAGWYGFVEGPRRIAVKPDLVKCDFDAAARTASVEFALPRGSYATVALRELMKSKLCVGQSRLTRVPLPAPMWDIGRQDPKYIETFEDVYEGRDPTSGDVIEFDTPDVDSPPLWTDPDAEIFSVDPADNARRFGERNFVHSLEARERRQTQTFNRLFEDVIVERMKDTEKAQYAEHCVPLPINSSRRIIESRIAKRLRRLPGAPHAPPKISLGRAPTRSNKPKFESLNKVRWNFM